MFTVRNLAELRSCLEELREGAEKGRNREGTRQTRNKTYLNGQLFAYDNALEAVKALEQASMTVAERNEAAGLPAPFVTADERKRQTRFRLSVVYKGNPEAGILGSDMTRNYSDGDKASKAYDTLTQNEHVMGLELWEERLLRFT